MRSTAFAGRNAKELLRDPLTLIFGIGFPVVLITLISVMRRSIPDIPNAMFGIENFAPERTETSSGSAAAPSSRACWGELKPSRKNNCTT